MLSQSDESSGPHVVQDPCFRVPAEASATKSPELGKDIFLTERLMPRAFQQMLISALVLRFWIRPRSMTPSSTLLADVLGSEQSRGSLPSSP